MSITTIAAQAPAGWYGPRPPLRTRADGRTRDRLRAFGGRLDQSDFGNLVANGNGHDVCILFNAGCGALSSLRGTGGQQIDI